MFSRTATITYRKTFAVMNPRAPGAGPALAPVVLLVRQNAALALERATAGH